MSMNQLKTSAVDDDVERECEECMMDGMREMAQNARQARAEVKKTRAPEEETEDVSSQMKEREEVRRDRMDEHRKQRNIARQRPDKLAKMRNEKDRDISEKIVLGLPDSRARAGETQFDQRLFDQTKGLDSGGIDDETYAAYDKPWRPQDNIQQHIYRPSKNIDSNIYGEDLDKIIKTNRFVADKGFAGGEGGAAQPRSGPVQFEKDEEDIFGLGELLQTNTGSASSSSRPREDDGPLTKRSRR